MRCIKLFIATWRLLLNYNNRKVISLSLMFFFSLYGVSAIFAETKPGILEVTQQGITVTGTVSDKFEPLPGVSVQIVGTSQGGVTDMSGKFSITVPGKGSKLQFSYLGYNTQVIEIGNKTYFEIILTENVSMLEEVVVVGYGVQKKESSVASITQVSGDDMLKMNATNVTNALTGQVAGVSVVQSSGQPGSDAGRIFIRGVSSWQSSDPLVLVDGIERNFNQIDPNEIETLSVLKDASATAVFGVRGANGVILITTKRGKKGEVKVSGSAEMTIKQPINVINPMSSYQTALVMNEAYKNDNAWGNLWSDKMLGHWRDQDLPWLYPDTDWQELMIKKNAFSQKYNVNISGGTDFARVFASLSYLYDGDIIKTEKQPNYDPSYKYDRYNYRFNIDLDLTKSTLLSLDAGGFIGIQNRPYETNIQRTFRPIYMMGPMEIPPYYPAEVLELYPDLTRPDQTGGRIAGTGTTNTENPMLANNYSGQSIIKNTNTDATIKLKQDLSFITKGLSLNAKVAYTHRMSYTRSWEYSVVAYRLIEDGSWSRFVGRTNNMDPELAAPPVYYNGEGVNGDPYRSWYFEGSANYSRTFDKHTISGLFLGLRHKRQSNVSFPSFEEGLVGRVTYDFDSRYAAEINMGYNGSEQFAPENRYGFFPSYGITYNLHNEKFYAPIKPIISKFKIRATHGEVGSDAAPSRWLYKSSYTTQSNALGGWDKYSPGVNPGVGAAGLYPLSIIEENAANINATWERAIKQNVAIELAFLKKNMFTLNLDFYREHRTQILLSRNAVPEWFGVGMKQQNLGETKSKGYEIELKYQHTIGNVYHWLKPAIWFSDNRIIARDDPMYKPEYQKQAGFRIHQEFGYLSQPIPAHIIQNADELMTSARFGGGPMTVGDTKYIDFNGDGVIDTNDQVPIGYSTQYPLYNYSLNGGLTYKNLTFDFLFQAVSHYSRVAIDAYAWPLHRLSNHVFEHQLDSWSPNNPNARYPQFRFDLPRTHNNIGDGAARSANTYDASFIRLKSLNLTYKLPKRTTNMMRLQNMSVTLGGNNLFTYSPNYPLTDPEGADGNAGRMIYGYYPLVRRMTLGLQITF